MNLALGLRQIFSYLLPGAVSLLILGVALLPDWSGNSDGKQSTLKEWQSLGQTLGEAPVLGSLVLVLLSIAMGVLTSSWFSLTIGTVIRVYGDPRSESLSKLPADLQSILGSTTEKKPLLAVALFYDFWSMVKLKVEGQLEFALFSVYALNFCSRVLGVVLIAEVIILFKSLHGALRGTISLAEPCVLLLTLGLAAVLLFLCMRYFFATFCYFAISLFTAVYELELTPEQRHRLMDHVACILDQVSDCTDGTVRTSFLYDPYEWRVLPGQARRNILDLRAHLNS